MGKIRHSMTPYFQDLDAFFAMGGHGFYVWLCWGIVVACVVFGVLYVKAERKRVLKHIQMNHTRKAARKNSTSTPS